MPLYIPKFIYLISDKLPQSVNHSNILALQLLIYLTQNRISDFHTLIETLPIDLLSNHHIQVRYESLNIILILY